MLRFKKAPAASITTTTDEGTNDKANGVDVSLHKSHSLRRISLEPKDNGYGVFAEFEPKKTTATDKNSGQKSASYDSYEHSHPRSDTVHETKDSAMSHIAAHLEAHANGLNKKGYQKGK